MPMRLGTIIATPNEFSSYARVRDENGIAYTVEHRVLDEDLEEDDDVAYYVDIWENDSGLIYYAEED